MWTKEVKICESIEMTALSEFFRNTLKNEEGQTFAEYAMIILFIIIAVIVIFPGLANALINMFNQFIAIFG